jgi:ribosome-associated toxin RatA of RatAB toxin-antitoxin module
LVCIGPRTNGRQQHPLARALQEQSSVLVSQSVLLPYAAEDMFDLIEQAEHYPQFVPWCTSANIVERSDEWVAARLEFTYLGFRFGFVTRNPKRRPLWLQVRLVEGPFKHFQGTWDLRPLGGLGCKVSFVLSCELAERFIAAIALPATEFVARKMVDAFVERARQTLPEIAPAPMAAATNSPPVDLGPRA